MLSTWTRGSMNTVFLPLEPTVSSSINFSLTRASATAMQSLRKCLRSVLSDGRFEYSQGIPEVHHVRYNEAIPD
eukprot:7521720-Pyramimonas_sp.AAC.1